MLLITGCDNSEAPAAMSRTPDVAVEPPPPAGAGIIRGKVQLVSQSGKLPEPVMLRGMGGQPVPDERVMVGANGELKNVALFIEGISDPTGSQRPPVVLDQVGFQYKPHVAAVQVGQTLRVNSSDEALHNVHIRGKDNPQTNEFTRTANEWLDYVYDKPEVLRLKCDVHPWMSAYVAVVENPYFDVSDEAGGYEITGLPDGDYTLVAWHELYGRQETPLSIRDGGAVVLDFTFEAP